MWAPDLTGRTQIRCLAIAEAMTADITAARMRAGERLPTHRDLAWRLQVVEDGGGGAAL